MTRAVRACAFVSLTLLASGCVAKIHYQHPLENPGPAACPESQPIESLVAVALSGGGSRAAVFGAAALEALEEHGLREGVTHLSSVSGGSIAATYYATQRPACGELPSAVERRSCWHDFFRGFRRTMRDDWRGAMIWREILKLRFGSNTRRATSLAEALDRAFLHGARFDDLPPEPALLVNAASYDDARRFVFSNLCLPADPSRARALSFSRPGHPRATPGDLPLSLAVASSASFPPVIGPVNLEIAAPRTGGETEYWHLGDGGLVDNTGIDALEEVFLRERERPSGRLRRALLISLDSGRKTSPGSLNLIRNFYLLFARPQRIVDVAQARGHAYHELYWQGLATELAAEGIALERIVLRHGDAQLSQWPKSCKRAANPRASDAERRAAIRHHLQEIDTQLAIGECDADLVESAAHALVHAALGAEKVRDLRGRGFSVREAAHPHAGDGM